MDEWKLELAPPLLTSPARDVRRLRWWFVRVVGIRDPEDLARAQDWVKRAGKVWDSGTGVVGVEDAGWFVVRSQCVSVMELRERFGPEHREVDRVEEMPHRSHATTLTRQIPLIG